MKALRYELGERFAVGGMAEVFLASAVFPDGTTAAAVVKRIRPQFSHDVSFQKMFLDEALITGRLDHPNIVELYDFGRIDEELFLALEYVPGMNLEELVARKRKAGQRIPLGIAAFVVAEILAGLHHAHEREAVDGAPLDVVHRDATPGNILLGFDGSVKVTDFGIAKAAVRFSGTLAGVVKGHFQFMAPEQVTAGAMDRRVDVYAAGMVLRFLLTGVLPFGSLPIPVMIERVARGEFAPLSEINPDVPPEIEAIVRKATSRQRDDRFPTADVFREQLVAAAQACNAWEEREGLKAILAEVQRDGDNVQPVGPRSSVMVRGKPGTDDVSVFLTGIGDSDEGDTEGGVPSRSGIAPPPPSDAPPPPPSGAPPPPPSPLQPDEITEVTSVPVGRRTPSPETDFDPEMRTEVVPHVPRTKGKVWNPDIDDALRTNPSVPVPPRASAELSRKRELVARPDAPKPGMPPGPLPAPLGGAPSMRFAAHKQSVGGVQFSSRGALLSCSNDHTLRVWDLARPAETGCLRGHSGPLTSLATGPADLVLTGSRDKTARVWRLGKDAPERVLAGHDGWVFAVAISPDGLLGASGSQDRSVRLWDLASGELLRVQSKHTDAVSAVSFLPDGRLLSASYDQTLRLWGLAGEQERELPGFHGPIRALAVSPDGRTAVSAGADGVLTPWNLETGEAGEPLKGHTGPVVSLAFVPGGALVASASYDGTARLWHVESQSEVGRVLFEGAVMSIAPAPTGGFLAIGNDDGSIALWAP